MPNEFILQQTTQPEKKYNSKVLIGNWYEEKCEPTSKYSNFYKEQKFEQNKYNISKLTNEPFMKSSQNWLNFQATKEKHFQTTNQRELVKPQEQMRHSELKPFIIRKGHFEKHPQEMADYREKWTKAPHFWDRTYMGQQK